jgi:hypothetical protein
MRTMRRIAFTCTRIFPQPGGSCQLHFNRYAGLITITKISFSTIPERIRCHVSPWCQQLLWCHNKRCVDSADLHSELCDQTVFRIRTETWALWDFHSAVDDRYGLGERRRAKIGKHPLERRNFFLCREAMQHR